MSTEIVENQTAGLPAEIVDRFAQFAQEAAAAEEISGTFITVRGGVMQFNKQPIAGNKLDVVVADSILENVYYEGDFDPDNPSSPVCYAFGKSDDEMRPHPKSSKPQHATCKGCPMNEFGSADKGKGKACKNTRRLALIPAGESDLNNGRMEISEAAYMKLPVTSVKNWSLYVNQVSVAHKRPPFGVVTEISVTPDPKTQFKVNFTCKGAVPADVTDAVFKRHYEQAEMIAFPYPEAKAEDEEPKAETTGKKKKY